MVLTSRFSNESWSWIPPIGLLPAAHPGGYLGDCLSKAALRINRRHGRPEGSGVVEKPRGKLLVMTYEFLSALVLMLRAGT